MCVSVCVCLCVCICVCVCVCVVKIQNVLVQQYVLLSFSASPRKKRADLKDNYIDFRKTCVSSCYFSQDQSNGDISQIPAILCMCGCVSKLYFLFTSSFRMFSCIPVIMFILACCSSTLCTKPTTTTTTFVCVLCVRVPHRIVIFTSQTDTYWPWFRDNFQLSNITCLRYDGSLIDCVT